MSPVLPLLLVPAVGALMLLAVPNVAWAARLNVAVSLLTLLTAGGLFGLPPQAGPLFLLDGLNLYLVAVTALVGFTSSVYSAGYVGHEVAAGRIDSRRLRFYHSMFQAFLASQLLALVSNNLGLLWVAVEMATLTTVLMVSLYRTPAAIEAAWKYFILCGVGIALALFGTILTALAARPGLTGDAAMTWSSLAAAATLDPRTMALAFVFILVGYGTKVGLAPLNAWLPDAHAEGPTPIAAVLSGLLLNVALYAVLRFKMLADAHPGPVDPSLPMLAMGLATLLLAALMLHRRRDLKRFFAYSSIEHMELVTVAFAVGGTAATFAGLLHMGLHSLTKSAIFFAVGQAAQATGSQRIADIRGLTASHPQLGWGLLFGTVAIAGLPPFGLFTSEVLLLSSLAGPTPWLAAAVALGLLLGAAALIRTVQGLCFGAPEENSRRMAGTLAPMWTHLALVLCLGLAVPETLAAWLRGVAAWMG